MNDDSPLLHLYNEDEDELHRFVEYKRLAVRGQIYALLLPDDEPERFLTFRVEQAGSDNEVYIYVIDPGEQSAVEAAWQRLHS